MSLSVELQSKALLRFGPPTDLRGGPTGGEESATKKTLTNGTGAKQADEGWHHYATLAGGATDNIDLQTQLDNYQQAMGLAGVVVLRIVAAADNPDNLECSPNAINGWNSVLKDPSDVYILPPGAVWHLELTGAVDYLVDATHKVLDIVNTDGAVAAHYTISIAGRTV